MTVTQYARKIRRSRARVYILLKEGQIPGAQLDDAGNWEIPENAPRPVLKRRGRKVSKRTARAAASA
jgi:hypothetical protein